MTLFSVLLLLSIGPVLAKTPEEKRALRLAALETGRAYCPKETYNEKRDSSMKFEVAVNAPELEGQRAKLKRPEFCRCRVEQRIAKHGAERAGTFYLMNVDDSDIIGAYGTPSWIEIRAIEKKIFTECFRKSLY